MPELLNEKLQKKIQELEAKIRALESTGTPSSADDQLFRNLFDLMTSSCAIYQVQGQGLEGRDYIVRLINRYGLQRAGKTLGDVVGKNLFDLRPDIDELDLIPVLKRTLDTGLPESGRVKMYENGTVSNHIDFYAFKLPSGEVATIYDDVTRQVIADEFRNENEEIFRLLAKHSPDHIIYQDRELRYAWVINPQLGLTEMDMIGKKDHDFLNKEDADALTRIKKNVIESGKTEFLTIPLLGPEGETQYFEGSFHPRLAESGENIGLFGYFRNITDRINSEDVISKSEAHLKTLLNTIPDLIWLKDPQGIYLNCNQAFESFFGAKESEIVGRTDHDFLDKDIADFFRDNDCKAMENDRPSINEEVLTIADSGYQGLFETIKTPMRDKDGRLTGILGVSRDISDLKASMAALELNAQRYEKAERIGLVGNWEYDLLTDRFWGSEQSSRTYGLDPHTENFSVEDIERCIPERERVRQAMVDLVEHGKPYNLEFEIYPADGSAKKVIRSIAEIVKDESGNPIKVLGVLHDITQQKQAETENIILERQLRQSQKLESIGHLAGGIAHDFNNILSAIIGYTELAIAGIETGTYRPDDLQEVMTAGKRAKDLVQQILAFARQSDDEIKPISVQPIVREALRLIRSTTPSTITIRQDLKSESRVMANATHIHQILINLCTNANQAMENGGGILDVLLDDIVLGEGVPSSNRTMIPGNYLRLRIFDTGTGISPEIIESIFDPYFTTKEQGHGTGLGLAMVHGIVESYGGSISVESESGQGSTFTILLPITEQVEEGAQIALDDNLRTGRERILFVDDEAAIARLGKQTFEQMGYTVTAISNSTEALEVFRSAPESFDLVITDMTMPVLCGDALAIELLKIRPELPIVLCTGFSNRITNEKAMKIGIKAFVFKPIMMTDLALTARSLLDEAKDTKASAPGTDSKGVRAPRPRR